MLKAQRKAHNEKQLTIASEKKASQSYLEQCYFLKYRNPNDQDTKHESSVKIGHSLHVAVPLTNM